MREDGRQKEGGSRQEDGPRLGRQEEVLLSGLGTLNLEIAGGWRRCCFKFNFY